MPRVNVKPMDGVFAVDRRAEAIRRPADTVVEIDGENMRPAVWGGFPSALDGTTPLLPVSRHTPHAR